MSDEKFVEHLQNAGLGEYTEAILKYKKPCVRLHAQPATEMSAHPIGATRIGGLPDLPPNMEWPMRNGRPCEFIAQINLSEAAAYDVTGTLPKDGLLLFFFDYPFSHDEDYQPYQLGSELIRYYTGDMALLKRADDYPDQLEEWQHYRACAIKFETDWMLPNWGNAALHLIYEKVFQYTNFNEPHPQTVEAYDQVVKHFEPSNDKDLHHLLGYPEPVLQDDPLFDVSNIWNGKTVNEQVLKEWSLLLQVSSDVSVDGPGMIWGDTSSLYYCIRNDDLAARRFENTCCVLEFL